MRNAPTSNEPTKLAELQAKIGYTFADEGWLRNALTHKSHAKQHNERLEFLGDAVLGYLIGGMLFRRDARLREDALSMMRAKIVRGTALAAKARTLDLQQYLLLGSGERKSGGRERDSILADALEAIIGAVHEDGGIESCRVVVERLFAADVAELDSEDLKDPKTRLQEFLQGAGDALPEYDVADVSGADHARRYTVICRLADGRNASATASSRRRAEQAAAAEILDQLEVST